MSGPKERVCQGDGSWSEHRPECRQKAMCGPPPKVNHARHNIKEETQEFDVETVVQYECFMGYDPQGHSAATCLFINGTTQWFGLDLKCIPRSCGHPGDIEHGRREGDVFTTTGRVTYHCDEGYELVGRANRYCLAKGEWTASLPSCKPVQCPELQNVKSGQVLMTERTYTSTVRYQCKFGYRLVGPAVRVCQANKRWDGNEPYCEEIDCGSPGILHNGYLKGVSTKVNNHFSFLCLDNMTFVGVSNTTTCLEDGTWSHPVPKCMAPCPVPQVEHGRVNHYAPDAKVPHGNHIEVDCVPRYELRYNNTHARCNNGSWTHKPTCIPARCKQLPKGPKNGMVIAPKTDHGMKALFRCKDGYQLEGPNTTECSYGTWSDEVPICNETYCPYPGTIENGRVLLVGHMGMYDYRPYVRKVSNNRQIMYECDRHYTLYKGPPGATCVDGRWSPPELPQCVRGSHPQVRWNRSVKETFIRRQRRIDSARERWLRNGKKKHKEFCKPLVNTPWMDVKTLKRGKGDSDVPKGTVVRVTCGKGYSLNIGNRTARCVRGNWKPREPECVTSPCQVPRTSQGVYHHYHEEVTARRLIDHGEVVTFSCDTGFQIMGPETLRCWYGEWAVNKIPVCLPGPCELKEIQRGSYSSGYRAGLTISHGSFVEYGCDIGFHKTIPHPLHCQQGRLTPQDPKCLRAAELHRVPGLEPLELRLESTSSLAQNFEKMGRASVQPCSLPERLRNTLLYRGSTFVEPQDYGAAEALKREKLPSGQENRYFPNGTEVLFKCLATSSGKKTTWKIVCQDGVWVGRPHNCDTKVRNSPSEKSKNRSCIFYHPHPDVVVFFRDRKLASEVARLPPGAEIVYRCRDIGKYTFEGSTRRRCVDGQWTGTEAMCSGLSQEYDYALEKAPTILFRHQIGQIAQSNDGKLIVYPGTVLHLECLWIRKYGTPSWEVSHNNRKYPEGWTNEPGRDSQLEYRLSIYHAKTEDSGIFTCVTPMSHQHSVEIVVSAVHCPPFPDIEGLLLSTASTKMNVKVVFSCDFGQTLVGSEQATCLSSGKWSAEPPSCQKVPVCPYPGTTKGATISKVKFYYQIAETIVFGCKEGYKLQGRKVLQCLDGGRWSSTIPMCHQVKKG